MPDHVDKVSLLNFILILLCGYVTHTRLPSFTGGFTKNISVAN